MKKTIVLLLALLLVAGAVFAEAIYIDKDPSTAYPESMNPPYTMNLKAVVPEGGGLDDSDGDDPDNIINGGLYIMVGYNNSNNSYAIEDTYATGELENLGFYSKSNPLIVSLTPETAGVETETGTLQFYVAAKANSSAARTTTVSFTSTSGGFKNTSNTSAPVIGIKFAGVSEAYSGESNGLSASAAKDGGTITVSASAGSYQKDYIYVAQTNATWTKSVSTPAGTYEADITVTVTATL